jgi:hypothetical protein
MAGCILGNPSVSRWLRVICATLMLILDAPIVLATPPFVLDFASSQDESPADPTSGDSERQDNRSTDELDILTRLTLTGFNRRGRPAETSDHFTVADQPDRALVRSLPVAPTLAIRLPIRLCRLTC